jgi:hypothetical protein
MSQATFKLEVKGINIPEEAQAEISKALNQTLMRKLGELDLAKDQAKAANLQSGDGSFLAQKYLINGGILMKVMSKELTTAIRQFESENRIPAEGGIGIEIMAN